MSTAIDPTSEKPSALEGPLQAAQGRFTILKCLGSGGMGTVHLAEDSRLHRKVAIKTIREDLCRNDEIRKRIERECLLHARIGSHPHIVTLYDRLDEGDRICLVLEFVEGDTLEGLLLKSEAGEATLTWKNSILITTQTLDALARIHGQNIVHRDIKPSNILVGHEDSGGVCAKLMDFGIARLEDPEAYVTAFTKEGAGGPGTPTYMAPEQIDTRTFGPISPATDIYAVGVMLYQLLSGTPPFSGTITEVFNGHINVEPISLDRVCAFPVPKPLSKVLAKALAKRPSDRFASAREFRDALEKAAKTISDNASAASQAVSAKTIVDRNKTLPVSQAGGPAEGLAKGGTVLATGDTRAFRRRSNKPLLLGIAAAAVLVVAASIGLYFGLSGLKDTQSQTAQDNPTGAPPTTDQAGPQSATAGIGPNSVPVPAGNMQTPSQPPVSPAIDTLPGQGPTSPAPATSGSAMDALEQGLSKKEKAPAPKPPKPDTSVVDASKQTPAPAIDTSAGTPIPDNADTGTQKTPSKTKAKTPNKTAPPPTTKSSADGTSNDKPKQDSSIDDWKKDMVVKTIKKD